MKKKVALLVLIALVAGSAYVCIRWYSYIFAKTVTGHIIRVERASEPANGYSIALRDAHGEIHISSSKDQQWDVANTTQCAQVTFFRYPPWEFEKGGTYFGARIDRLYDCPPAPATAHD
jgi:hypothetical protein